MKDKRPDSPEKAAREDRLRDALRANLQRRKAQARARAAEHEAEPRPAKIEQDEKDQG